MIPSIGSKNQGMSPAKSAPSIGTAVSPALQTRDSNRYTSKISLSSVGEIDIDSVYKVGTCYLHSTYTVLTQKADIMVFSYN